MLCLVCYRSADDTSGPGDAVIKANEAVTVASADWRWSGRDNNFFINIVF